jgi:hypothetical protein
MVQESAGASFQANDNVSNRMSSAEAHEDINEFNATRNTLKELLRYKQSLIEKGGNDIEKINELRRKALDAINHLFDDFTTVSDI